jgi:hypothetical protein
MASIDPIQAIVSGIDFIGSRGAAVGYFFTRRVGFVLR